MKKRFLSVLLTTFLLSSCGEITPTESVENSSTLDEQSSESTSSSDFESSSSTQENDSSSVDSSSSEDNSSTSSIFDNLPPISYVQVFAPAEFTHIYAWVTNNNKTTELCSSWPGTNLKSFNEEWKTYDFPGYTSVNVIFSKGSNQNQTADLYCPSEGYYWFYNNSLHDVPPGQESSGGGSSSGGNYPDIPSYQADSWKNFKFWNEYPTDYWKVNNKYNGTRTDFRQESIYFAITNVPQFIGMIFADKLKVKFKGHRNLLIFIQICTIVGKVLAWIIGFEGNNILIGMIIMAICAIPSGAASIAQTSLFCDSVDYMEWKTGKRTEGVTFAMQTFFTKISSGITGALATFSLSILGYVAIEDVEGAVYLGTQTQAFEDWIWPLTMLTPAIAAVLYIIPLLFIKYTPEQKAQVEKELAERRALSEQAVEAE